MEGFQNFWDLVEATSRIGQYHKSTRLGPIDFSEKNFKYLVPAVATVRNVLNGRFSVPLIFFLLLESALDLSNVFSSAHEIITAAVFGFLKTPDPEFLIPASIN